MLNARTNATSETRKVGKQSGGDSAGAVSSGDSVEVRVHLYERSFPEEPDRRARSNANDVRTALDTGAAFGGCQRHRADSPDDRDMHVGRERPPEGRAWGEEGGSQMGVASRPTGRLLGWDNGADCETDGTERRRRQARSR
jgi:hypothetical protein